MPLRVGFLIYPEFTQFSMTGAFAVFTRMPDTEVLVLAKTRDAVPSDHGLHLLPNGTMNDCPHLDVLCVPGGPGCTAVMEDAECLAFLGQRGPNASFVTSVCTGSLVLGAAGLLRGYRATTHWSVRPVLSLCEAIPSDERVTVDRNRYTSSSASAGMDMAFALAEAIFNADVARAIQLQIDYAPRPPSDTGSPLTAPSVIVERERDSLAHLALERREAMRRATERWEIPAHPNNHSTPEPPPSAQ